MTDNSNIVLRWAIDNESPLLETGKVESGVFDEGGFKWTAGLERRDQDKTILSLRCDVDHNGKFKSEIEGSIYLLWNERCKLWRKGSFRFNESNRRWLFETSVSCERLANMITNNNFSLEFRFKILSSERDKSITDPGKFASPNRRSDVVLKIEGEKLHVSKEILAIHSPFFDTLFFGDFAENGKEEVEIKDVVYEEFIDLLNVIYVQTMEITDRTVQHILKLADQFQMEDILIQSTEYLTKSKGIDVVTKLMLADRYRLVSLRDHCLESFATVSDLNGKLNASSEHFSEGMKAAIYDRIVKLPLQ